MANFFSPLLFALSLIYIAAVCVCFGSVDEDRKVYIVYMGALPHGEYSPSSHHLSMLEDVIEEGSTSDFMVRSYGRSFNGFVAKLNDQELQKLSSMDGVVSVFPSRNFQLQTTRSWDFMGLSETVNRNHSFESDIIVGVLDTGIWPESESFSDEGFSAAPKKWKGECEGGENFTCNNKVIGARVYISESVDTARDMQGHGSHTASTAAGNKVMDVGFYGIAQGNARGGVASARLAVYKVCTYSCCRNEDILAGFDDAIADGVDIISVSLGFPNPLSLYGDVIAIGSFHAMEKGILTSQAGGNAGPIEKTIGSVAPWILSVAASTIDRQIIDKVVLGNGTTILGYSINPFELNGTKHPLVYGAALSECSVSDAQNCFDGCLDRNLVKGKIVLCDQPIEGEEATQLGVLGVIMLDYDTYDNVSDLYPLPAAKLKPEMGQLVHSYINSTKNPMANILKSEAINDSTAPVVAFFSSRGPNSIVPEILKPDISAPGVDILAAFPPSGYSMDKRPSKYSILSGTSMACPHATGAAAYVKSFHPDWSPSAIKSALMTTAWPMDATRNQEREFAYGAGHINPVNAINPGLVFETLKGDYIKMLCNIGYDTEKVRTISGDNSSCSQGSEGTAKDLNYPSMTALVQTNISFATNFTRTVKNVGYANSTYKASITFHSKVKIDVAPSVLSFKSLNEEHSFTVTVVGDGLPENSMESASLEWSDGTHLVRSPIVVFTYSDVS